LLVVFLIHEDIVVTLLVEIGHIAWLDESALDFVLGTYALIGFGAGLDVFHLHLHECSTSTPHMDVVTFQDTPDAFVPLYQVSDANFCCKNFGHYFSSVSQ
jgi:hypothetical protein